MIAKRPQVNWVKPLTSCYTRNGIKLRPLHLLSKPKIEWFSEKSGYRQKVANYVGLENLNLLLMLVGIISYVEILQVKYLNNLVE